MFGEIFQRYVMCGMDFQQTDYLEGHKLGCYCSSIAESQNGKWSGRNSERGLSKLFRELFKG